MATTSIGPKFGPNASPNFGLLQDWAVSDPDELNLGLLLFIPYRFLESGGAGGAREQGHDIPLNQARVFQRIDAEGSRLSELAEASQLTQADRRLDRRPARAGRLRPAGPDPDDARAGW